MSPPNSVKETPGKRKSWSEINKTRKEERKKLKEKNLAKKLEKQKLKEAAEETKAKEEVVDQNRSELSTVSIAVPGTILENAQSPVLCTYLAGQIARAACIFQVDEVVIFDDHSDEVSSKKSKVQDAFGQEKTSRKSCVQLGRILQYLECPQYLRKHFFPIHNDLKFCGILNPLNAPHHLGPKDMFIYREGVVLNVPAKTGKGSLVNVGLHKNVRVDKLLPAGIRCTVRLNLEQKNARKNLQGTIVTPLAPRQETGVYWGYSVRIASTVSEIFSQCPYKDGYDLTIGTSDTGDSVDTFECPKFKHLLVVFGGLEGLESALASDDVFNSEVANDPRLLFDAYLNTVPGQGSKTVRTEEAILVSMAALRPKLNPEYRKEKVGDGYDMVIAQ